MQSERIYLYWPGRHDDTTEEEEEETERDRERQTNTREEGREVGGAPPASYPGQFILAVFYT